MLQNLLPKCLTKNSVFKLGINLYKINKQNKDNNSTFKEY